MRKCYLVHVYASHGFPAPSPHPGGPSTIVWRRKDLLHVSHEEWGGVLVEERARLGLPTSIGYSKTNPEVPVSKGWDYERRGGLPNFEITTVEGKPVLQEWRDGSKLLYDSRGVAQNYYSGVHEPGGLCRAHFYDEGVEVVYDIDENGTVRREFYGQTGVLVSEERSHGKETSTISPDAGARVEDLGERLSLAWASRC